MLIEELEFTPFYSTVQAKSPKSLWQRVSNLFRKDDIEAPTEDSEKVELAPVDHSPILIAARLLMGEQPTIAVFRNGTMVISYNTEEDEWYTNLIREHGPMKAGYPSGDYSVAILDTPTASGFVATYDCPYLLSFCSFDEFPRESSYASVGQFLRFYRTVDGDTPQIINLDAGNNSGTNKSS